MGAEAIQVHTQSPRMWKPYAYADEMLSEFSRRVAESPVVALTICHASYLINLATSDAELKAKSCRTLERNLEVSNRLGARGLVLHLGSHLGSGLEAVVPALAAELIAALDRTEDTLGRPSCPLLMENTAGAGGTIGRDFDELARVLEAAGGDERLGLCLDTQHLFASGVSFDTLDEADAVLSEISRTVGLGRLACLHVNDSKVPFGANRDRHENLGAGFIGTRALGSLLGHPLLDALPAVLEVPGREKKGPGRDDLLAVRAIHAAGRRRWRARELRQAAAGRPATPTPRRAPPPGRDGRRGSPPDPARGGAPSRRGRSR